MDLTPFPPRRPRQRSAAQYRESVMRRVRRTDDCWIWTGSVRSSGYGQVKGYLGYGQNAHRAVYELERGGLIPPGYELDHLCRNRICVRPDHLEVVTQTVNNQRGYSPPAMQKRKTHCVRGHEFTDANTYRPKPYHRNCRTCIREKQHARWRTSAQKGTCPECSREVALSPRSSQLRLHKRGHQHCPGSGRTIEPGRPTTATGRAVTSTDTTTTTDTGRSGRTTNDGGNDMSEQGRDECSATGREHYWVCDFTTTRCAWCGIPKPDVLSGQPEADR